MVKDIPAWARGALSLEGAKRIEDAVLRAEKDTSGEIVPILVRRSSSVALIPKLISLLILVFGLALIYSWNTLEAARSLWGWTGALAIAGGLGHALARWSFLQRVILPRAEQKLAAHQRALLEFYEGGLDKTEGETGILLFVSLMEHEAVVLFDKGIARHCQPAMFQAVVDALIHGAKAGDLAAGYEQAITLCTKLLSPHFPPKQDNPNEKADYLRIEE